MSINWVMLSDAEGFTPLPGEQRLFTSPPRTALSLQTLHKYPGREPFSLQSSSGQVYLTTRRIVYLPSSPTPQLQSFTAPILNLHDTHVTAPFFGPNAWAAILQPVPGGGIPPQHAALEIKLTFKDGGAFDFHTGFERIKERTQQAVETARESGRIRGDGSEQGTGRGGGALSGVDMNGVHLDELPAYDAPGSPMPEALGGVTVQSPPDVVNGTIEGASGNVNGPQEITTEPAAAHASSSSSEHFTPPSEPPPGYEEVQRESVAEELERRLRGSVDREGSDSERA